MRFLILAVLVAGCGPGIDPLIGSYPFTMTGTDTNTSPNTNMMNVAGSGTVAVTTTAALMGGYLVVIAPSDTNGCSLEATVNTSATTPELTIKGGQTCALVYPAGNATATITTGKAALKLNDTRAMDVMTLEVSYTYTGATFFLNQAFAGGGKRTYTGTRR